MKKCCEETYKMALEQVLFTIKINEVDSVWEIIKSLEYSLEELNRLDKLEESNE